MLQKLQEMPELELEGKKEAKFPIVVFTEEDTNETCGLLFIENLSQLPIGESFQIVATGVTEKEFEFGKLIWDLAISQ